MCCPLASSDFVVTASNIPTDFPRDPFPGAVPGVQPKVLAREIGDQYVVGLTDGELQERYDVCADLVQQLIPYCLRKLLENPTWTQANILLKVAHSAKSKKWGLSTLEVDWIVIRLADELGWPRPVGVKNAMD
jgi:hypothetical protein